MFRDFKKAILYALLVCIPSLFLSCGSSQPQKNTAAFHFETITQYQTGKQIKDTLGMPDEITGSYNRYSSVLFCNFESAFCFATQEDEDLAYWMEWVILQNTPEGWERVATALLEEGTNAYGKPEVWPLEGAFLYIWRFENADEVLLSGAEYDFNIRIEFKMANDNRD